MSKRLILAYKNFAANQGISHIGLGVAALHCAKMLRRQGIRTEVWPVVSAAALAGRLAGAAADRDPATHVVISAPWIPSQDLQRLISQHQETRLVVACHSNVGFLQADANGVRLVREAMEIEHGSFNFQLAGNSRRFCDWIRDTYNRPCAYLPNLYSLDAEDRRARPSYRGGTLRIGAFGATRPLKNLMTAAGAAVAIARDLAVDSELWLSSGRAEGGGCVLDAIRTMLRGVPGIELVESGWQSWPQFRQTVGHMNLLLQPSYTESFNMVTADGVAEGVPSVVSSAIDWAPDHWKADIDDTLDVARVGRTLLFDARAGLEGRRALESHNRDGIAAWLEFLA